MTPDDLFRLAEQSQALRSNAARALKNTSNPHPVQEKLIKLRAATWRAKRRLELMIPSEDGFENAMLELKWALDALNDHVQTPAAHRNKDQTLLNRILKLLRRA